MSYADFNTGRCFPGITTIQDLTGYGRATVIQAIKELEDWGLIEVMRRKGSHNIYQLKYFWGSEGNWFENRTSGVQKLNHTGSISDTLTTTNNKSHINKTNVVSRQGGSNSSASSDTKQGKKLLYQLRIAEMQQQQTWIKTIQELFRRIFHKELPAEIVDEKLAQGLKVQFLMQILKNIDDPGQIRNPIGWFRSIDEYWNV